MTFAATMAHSAPGAPGPRGLELARALLALREDPLRAFEHLRARHGSIVRIALGARTFYIVASPAAARHVLCDNARNYGKATWSYDLLRLVLGRGLLTSEGAAWRSQRRLLAPVFQRSRLPHLAETTLACADATLERWRALGDGSVLDLGREMAALSLEVLVETTLGVDRGDAGDVTEHLGGILTYIRERTGRPVDFPVNWPLPHHVRFRRHLRALDAIVRRVIETRRRAPHGGDLVGTLLAARDETGRALDDSAVADQVKTFLLAGHETTANLLTWTLGLLARHPAAAAAVTREVAGSVGQAPIAAENVRNLAFTRAVLAESLRLYPPLWLVERRAHEADTLDGHPVERGATIAVSQYLLHRNPEHFPAPERFEPARFLHDEPAGARARGYLPFGLGSRTCIGDTSALTQAAVVIARLAQAAAGADGRRALSLALVERELPPPEAFVTLRPAEPVRVRVTIQGAGRGRS
ncbi:MAG TPA: cytochrome P450 [Polyangiaceae bacterium]